MNGPRRKRAHSKHRCFKRRSSRASACSRGGIAHDFNNLLTGIVGNCDLMLADVGEDHPLRGSLEAVEQASWRAADLCRQMLAYAGKTGGEPENFDIGMLSRDVIGLIRASVPKRIRIETQLDAVLPPNRGDRCQIRQVVMNLVLNAAESYGERDGEVVVRAAVVDADAARFARAYLPEPLPAGRYTVLEVVDHGEGMSPETLARIFDPFFTTKFTGRGLGLASVLGIVRAHRGAVEIETEPGRGTVFRVLLPSVARETVAPTASRKEEEPRAKPAVAASGAVLVVDDEAMVRAVVRTVLEEAGYRVRTAEHGAEGLEILRNQGDSVSCVVLDLTMPVMDGPAMLAELRASGIAVPVVLMTGYTDRGPAYARRADVEGFVNKPFTGSAMIAAVAEAIEGREDRPSSGALFDGNGE